MLPRPDVTAVAPSLGGISFHDPSGSRLPRSSVAVLATCSTRRETFVSALSRLLPKMYPVSDADAMRLPGHPRGLRSFYPLGVPCVLDAMRSSAGPPLSLGIPLLCNVGLPR
jgi:hypothetical protein